MTDATRQEFRRHESTEHLSPETLRQERLRLPPTEAWISWMCARRQRTAAPLDAAATALCSPCSARQQRQRGPFGGGGTISERTGALEHSPADWVSPQKGLMAKCPNSPCGAPGVRD